MSDLQRTLTYVAIAIGAAVLAWEPWRPTRPTSDQVEDEKTLFPKFTNPLAAKSLEIIKYDEDTSKLDRFKVAQVNGIWTIPSHQNYPADAVALTQHYSSKAIRWVLDAELRHARRVLGRDGAGHAQQGDRLQRLPECDGA